MIPVADTSEITDKKLAFAQQVYEAALAYIKLGMYVVPLRQGEKLLPESKHNVNYGSASRKKAIIEKWFNPEDGKFAGWNIGLACGREGGIFAVDIDMHGVIDGFETWNKLIEQHGEVIAPMQDTPSGGRHIIFRWQENAVSSTGKLGRGIDTRGGEEKKCKSHIVAYPSVVKGKQYKWATGGEVGIADIPPWVMDRMGVAWRSATGVIGRGSEEMEPDDIEKKLPKEQIIRMLDAVDPDTLNYDEWLRVGQAINSQLPDDGCEIWDAWSARGKRYKNNECRIRWRGFNPAGPVRVGTLFYYAKNSGWSQGEGDVSTNPFDEVVAEINEKFAVVLIGNKVKIVFEKEDMAETFSSHYELLAKDDFTLMLADKTHEILNDRGQLKRVPVSQLWLADRGRRSYMNGLGLFPDGERPGFYNTWRGFAVDPIQGDCEPILNHINKVICGGHDDYCEWLLDWLSDLVQDPANPKGCAVAMRGEEGTGKGTLGNLMCTIFGSHSRHLIDEAHLTSNFNAHMVDALFVFADEITWGGNIKANNKLKGMVTERQLLSERKGVDAVSYRNMTHLMIASNEEWIVPAGPQSRRWFVLDVSSSMANNREYFTNLNHYLDNGGREAFLYYLTHREITANLTRAPETDELHRQRVLHVQQDTFIQWWAMTLEKQRLVPWLDDDDTLWPDSIERITLYEAYQLWCTNTNRKPISNAVFYKKMGNMGASIFRGRVGESRPYMLKILPLEDSIQILKTETSINLDE